MDAGVREPVAAAHPSVSVFSASSLVCGEKHVADSGQDSPGPYAFHSSLVQGPLPPQALQSPSLEGQPPPSESFVAAGLSPAPEEAEQCVGELGCFSRCGRSVQGPSSEGPGVSPDAVASSPSMPQAAGCFPSQEKLHAEPSATDDGRHVSSFTKTRREGLSSVCLFAALHQQQQPCYGSTGCCVLEDRQQQEEPCLVHLDSASPPAVAVAAAPAAVAVAAADEGDLLTAACGPGAPDAANRLSAEGTHRAVEVILASARKACVAQQSHLESPRYGRMDSANGSTYAAHEDEAGSQSLPSPGVEWAEVGSGGGVAASPVAAAAQASGSPAESLDAAGVVADASAASPGVGGASEGGVVAEMRRFHRSGRLMSRSRSGRHLRVASSLAAPGGGTLSGAYTLGDARRRGDGRTSAACRRGKAKRRNNKGRDGRRSQQQPLRLTSEVLLQLEARTSRAVETTVAAGTEGLGSSSGARGGGAGGSLSFFWMVKQRAEQSREAAGDLRRLSAFQRAEMAAAAEAKGSSSSLLHDSTAAAAAAAEADDCSSQSQRSSEVSTKGTVNHRCREDDVLINLCENPSDLWYGLKTQDGKPVVVHARPRHASRRQPRQRRPPHMAAGDLSPATPQQPHVTAAGAAASNNHAPATAYHPQQRLQQLQQLQQMQQLQHLLGSGRPSMILPPVEQQQQQQQQQLHQHRQQPRRHQHRNRSQKDTIRRHSSQRSTSQMPPVASHAAPSPSFSVLPLARQRGRSVGWQQQQQPQVVLLQSQPQQLLMVPSPQQSQHLQQAMQPQQMQQLQQQLQMQQQQVLQHRAERKRRHKERKRGRSSSSSAAAAVAAAPGMGLQQQMPQQQQQQQQQPFCPAALSKESRRVERRRRYLASKAGDHGQYGAAAAGQRQQQPDRVVYVHSPDSVGSSRPAAAATATGFSSVGAASQPPTVSSAQPWVQQLRSCRGSALHRVSEEAAAAAAAAAAAPVVNSHSSSTAAAFIVSMAAGPPPLSQQLSAAVGVGSYGEPQQPCRPARRPRLDDGSYDSAAGGASLSRSWSAASAASATATAAIAAGGQDGFKPPAPLTASQRASAKRRGLNTFRQATHGSAPGPSVGVQQPHPDSTDCASSCCGVTTAAAGVTGTAPAGVSSSSGSATQQQQQQQQQLPPAGLVRPVHSYGDLDAADRMAQQPFRVVSDGSCSTVDDPASVAAAAAAGQLGQGYHAPMPPVQAKQLHARRMTARERVQWQLAKSRGML